MGFALRLESPKLQSKGSWRASKSPRELLPYFDLSHHPEVLVREFLAGRLSVGGERHLAVQEIMSGRKVAPQPDNAVDLVTIEGPA